MPWSWLEAVAAFAIATGATLLVALPISAVAGAAGVSLEALNTALIPVTPIAVGLTTLAVVGLRHRGGLRRLLGWRPARRGDWLAGLAVGLAGYLLFGLGLGALLQAAISAAGAEVPVVQETFRQAAAGPSAWLLLLSAVVLAPVAEELLYRGMLFQALAERLGTGWGIWLSALAFGATHASIGSPWLSNALLVAVIVPLGALLAWAFHRRGTLLVPILGHAAFNAINATLLIAAPDLA
ncbi:MAG: CPBP family intramembrane glutamic endopeptidase [Actinomycetota bacterium]